MKYCAKCGTQLSDDARFCTACGAPCDGSGDNNGQNNDSGQIFTATPRKEHWFDSVTRCISRFAGGTNAVRPPLKTIFGGIFEKHRKGQSDEIFICGTEKTTPELGEGDRTWPKTWLWTRIFIAFAIAFALLHLCCSSFGNLKAYPGLMVIGAFMVPIAVMVFFFELNTPKNISFFTIIKYFLVGGCSSLVIALLLFDFFSMELNPWLEAVLVGLIEESAKLAIVALVIWRDKNAKYGLNGLLIGAAIGAGFAAFESAGFAFESFLETFLNNVLSSNAFEVAYSDMVDNIILRAILAPGGHVIWAAMAGYAIMLVKGNKTLNMSFLNQKAFWKVFWIPIALHAIWDMPIAFGNSIVGVVLPKLLLVVIGWVVIFVLIGNCLSQIGALLREREAEGLAADSTSETSE